MVALTFPDGARRDYPPHTTGLDIAKGISPSLAKRTVAMALDGKLADLADPIEHDAKIEFLTRDDPRALELIRHDAAHVLAEAVQTLWPGTQVTIGPVIDNGFYYDFFRNEPFTPEDFDGDRKEDARDHRARQAVHQGSVVARRGQARVRRQGREFQGRAGRRHPGRPEDQDLQAGRLVRSVPRPAHDLDRQDRQRVQADEGRRRLLARRFQPRDALAHLRHRLRQAGRARRLSEADRGSRKARPSPARPRDGSVPLPGRSARLGVLASQGLDAVPDAGELHPPAPAGGRLCRGQCAAADRFIALGRVRPHGDVPRRHVPGAAARGGRAHLRGQADELPRPHPDFQERAEILSRPAVQDRRVRQGAPLRAVRRAARADAGARLHPGRRAHLHHRGADRRGSAQGQRSDPVDLRRFRLRRRAHQILRPAGKAHRRRRGVGQGRSGVDSRRSKRQAGRGRSTRAKAPSTAPSSNTCCATPSAATGNAAPCRSISTCRAGSARSISTSIPTR